MSKSMSSQIGSDLNDGEEFIKNKESRCLTNEQGLIRPNIDLFDINNPRLQYIFNKETDELEKSFAALKKTIGEGPDGVKSYKLEVMICLWFCIHKESLQEVKLVFELDPIAKDIIKNLRDVGMAFIVERDIKEQIKKGKKRPN